MFNLKESRILITGGAGFVGSFIVDQLIQEEVKEVVIIDNFVRGSLKNIEQALKSGRVTVIEGDIRNKETLNKAFQNIDFCFHMAALRITHCTEYPKEAIDVMIQGTYHVIECCLEHKVSVPYKRNPSSL
jgi:UDP-glucose 4-epimerase